MSKFFDDLLEKSYKEVTSSKIYLSNNLYHPKGIYSEQIFGPIKDYSCQCGELFGKLNDGKRCTKCGVICGPSILRYKEFGYVKLKLPVLNPLLLDIFIKKLFKSQNSFKEIYEKTVLEDKFYLLNLQNNKLEILPEFDHNELINAPTSNDNYKTFVENLLNKMVLENIITNERKEEILTNYLCEYPVFGLYSLYKLFTSNYVQHILNNYFDNHNNYEIFHDILFLNFVPVIPPEIRPLVQLTNGDIIEHELSKIYRSLIRLNYETELFKNVVEQDDYVIQNIYQKDFWCFRLQKLVAQLYEKIVDSISGKEGKIRSFVLGKVIDFSGRAVVVPSLKIKPYEIMIPYEMAKEVLSIYFVAYVQKHADKDLAIKFLHVHNNLLQKDVLSKDDYEKIDELFDKFIDDVNNKKIKILAFANRQPSIWPYSMSVFDVIVNKDRNAYVVATHPIINSPFNLD